MLATEWKEAVYALGDGPSSHGPPQARAGLSQLFLEEMRTEKGKQWSRRKHLVGKAGI